MIISPLKLLEMPTNCPTGAPDFRRGTFPFLIITSQ
jgi:hypothetical protein